MGNTIVSELVNAVRFNKVFELFFDVKPMSLSDTDLPRYGEDKL